MSTFSLIITLVRLLHLYEKFHCRQCIIFPLKLHEKSNHIHSSTISGPPSPKAKLVVKTSLLYTYSAALMRVLIQILLCKQILYSKFVAQA
jgi:hypothetical protein